MIGVAGSNRFRSRAAASLERGAGDGGDMDDVLKRLGVVEASVADIRVQLGAVTAVLPHLATKADLTSVKTEIKEEVRSVRAEVQTLRADMHSLETSIVKWIIGTAIATTAVALSIAKFALNG
jgi:Mg2+ and Co2+ transporter CorA